MHTLGREIRFSINPFSQSQDQGYNSYVSKPNGTEGLTLYLSLWVELSSDLNPETGFIVNVAEIDRAVRKAAIPLITENIRSYYCKGQIPALQDIGQTLQKCWRAITQEFAEKQVKQLELNLNPYRSISIQSEDCIMMYYNEKFEFSAMHRLWNDKFNEAENFKTFGKCANPAGHGHNYILDVKVMHPINQNDKNWTKEYQKTVKESFLDIVDHKNLNKDVLDFEMLNPTVENLARFAWEKLVEKFNNCKLCLVTIWENDRTYCSYSEGLIESFNNLPFS